ncbi:cytochrome c [Melioribacteraceae bacterium 4301-Me]|uniref:c-type cytochrome n=1 Tax=Pyranulibacter aquaticus TaxID=3163344 RepID=UPI00359668C8
MTNAQKWLAAFLVVFVVLFLIGRATKKEETPSQIPMGMLSETEQSVNENADGKTLTVQLGCISCHGENLEGTKLAPSLEFVKNNWMRDNLINYLRNPSSYAGDKRFEGYRAKYPNVIMPSYNNIDVKDLGKIADYLLSR